MITLFTDSEGAYPDPSEERLDALIDRIGDDVEFLIVERDDAPGFAQHPVHTQLCRVATASAATGLGPSPLL